MVFFSAHLQVCSCCGGGWWACCAACRGAAPLIPTMALSWALRLPCRHLRPLSALLRSLPGRDHSLLTEKTAAKQKEKKKPRKGCSLPGSSWEERYGSSKLTKHSSKALGTCSG